MEIKCVMIIREKANIMKIKVLIERQNPRDNGL